MRCVEKETIPSQNLVEMALFVSVKEGQYFISTKALVPSCKGSLTSADLLIDVLPKAGKLPKLAY